MDCNPPGSSVRGISQGRTLEWIATSFSSGSSQPRDQTPHLQYPLHWPLSHLGSPPSSIAWTQICIFAHLTSFTLKVSTSGGSKSSLHIHGSQDNKYLRWCQYHGRGKSGIVALIAIVPNASAQLSQILLKICISVLIPLVNANPIAWQAQQ